MSTDATSPILSFSELTRNGSQAAIPRSSLVHSWWDPLNLSSNSRYRVVERESYES
jgi:hypothetical protein